MLHHPHSITQILQDDEKDIINTKQFTVSYNNLNYYTLFAVK